MVSQPLPVTVQPVIASLKVEPAIVRCVGDQATVSWSTQWASGVTLNGQAVDANTAGSRVIAATGHDAFTLVAYGQNAKTLTADLTVTSAIEQVALAVGVKDPSLLTISWSPPSAFGPPVPPYSEAYFPAGQSVLLTATDDDGNRFVLMEIDASPAASEGESVSVTLTGHPTINQIGSAAELNATGGGSFSLPNGVTTPFQGPTDVSVPIQAPPSGTPWLWQGSCTSGHAQLSWKVFDGRSR